MWGGNPEKELFVLRNGTLRLIFQEHFVLRIILTASLAFGSACKQAIEKTETASVSANITEKQEATIADDSKGKEFLETFYDGMDKIDGDDFDLDKVYAHIKDNSTEHAIDVLKELYEYDCEGECLAFWTLTYGAFNDPGSFISRKITPQGNNVFLVENKYEYNTNRIIVEVTETKDGYKISDIKTMEE